MNNFDSILKIKFVFLKAINCIWKRSGKFEDKINTSLFVQKPFSRTNYIECNFEPDLDIKNQFGHENIADPIINRGVTSLIFVDILFIDPCIIKNTANVEFINKNLNNVHLFKINSLPAVREHLTLNFFVDEAF